MSGPDIDETHDPALESWVPGAHGHAAFPIQNLPYGIFAPGEGLPRPGVAIGEAILDLQAAAARGMLSEPVGSALSAGTLNALMALPGELRQAARRRISMLLSDPRQRAETEVLLYPAASCTMYLPAQIGDYTDFYVGIHHAARIGALFRPDHPLLPNYKHIPIGYHGRASSVRVSGTAAVRPRGQQKAPDADAPVFGPSQRLDYELELGVWIGPGNALGESIPIGQAAGHIAGLCLLNDWSARDLQAWEYQPLGPFLGKNFLTTISPWVITAEALAPFRTAQPARPTGDPAPLPYLWDEADQAQGAFAIRLEAHLSTAAMRLAGVPPHRISTGPATNMYWTVAQMVTHHTSNGCNLNPGDLLGTGTIAAPSDEGCGSLIEITRGGTRPLHLPNGEIRRMLQDGDEILLSATAHAPGRVSIGFGPCRGEVRPAR